MDVVVYSILRELVVMLLCCSNPSCTGAALNHGVTLVGYGYDSDAQMDYWIIKNSFGKAWGEAGYFRMQKGVNMCGIENWGAVPIVSN